MLICISFPGAVATPWKMFAKAQFSKPATRFSMTLFVIPILTLFTFTLYVSVNISFPMNCNKVPWIKLQHYQCSKHIQTSRAACRCLLHCSAVHPRDQSTFCAKSRWWHCCLVQACKYKRHLKMPSMFSRSQANERIRQGTQCIEHFVSIFCVNSSGGNIPHHVALHQRSVSTMDGDANLGRP